MIGIPNVPSTLPTVGSFQGPAPRYPYTVSGITRDGSGVALGSCVVDLYRTADDTVAARTVSDASGNYLVSASEQLTHYAVAYKAGSPDVAGTTVNTLVGT